jgi:hypothetical protein
MIQALQYRFHQSEGSLGQVVSPTGTMNSGGFSLQTLAMNQEPCKSPAEPQQPVKLFSSCIAKDCLHNTILGGGRGSVLSSSSISHGSVTSHDSIDASMLGRAPQRITITLFNRIYKQIVQRSTVEGRSMSNLGAYLLERAAFG